MRLQCTSDLMQHKQRRIDQRPFKLTDIGAIDLGFSGQCFLAEGMLAPQGAHVGGQCFLKSGEFLLHPRTVAGLRLLIHGI